MKSAAFDYLRAETLAAAVALLDSETRPFLGGQSLAPTMNLRLARPARLVDLKPLGLTAMQADATTLHLGAGLTHAAIEDSGPGDASQGLLPHVARGIAYRGVRNRGTLGGSLAHADPAADWLTVMVLLGATIFTSSRAIAAENFCLGAYATALAPNEIITGVDVPRLSGTARWGYQKINRKTGAFADALGAAVLDGALARVVVGAIDTAPMLLPETTQALRERGAAAAIEGVAAEFETRLTHLDPPGRALRAVAVTRALEALR
jgi:carbon-monoxide dehydrogenase medium subunit